MFEKNMKIAYLLDLYGEALDEHIASVLKAYYNEDLSLAEIASDEGISRQGVRHLIKKGEEQLHFFEEKLALGKRAQELSQVCKSLERISNSIGEDERFSADAEELMRIAEIILKGNQDVRESY